VKVLFIGGTGNISTAVSRLCVQRGIELHLLNRGKRSPALSGTRAIVSDITNAAELSSALKGHEWDAVVDWIAFREEDIQRDYELFRGKTKQYIFISSASAYERPAQHPVVTETTPLSNPFWQYSRDKIACEMKLRNLHQKEGFPATIIRPSHTYDTVIPVPIGGWTEYTTVDRIKRGKKIIVHGDGSSLWVMTHADDFAKGFFGLIGNQKAVGEAFHITSDEVLTWDQIHAAVGEAVGCNPNIVHISSEMLAMFDEELRGTLIGDKGTSVIFDNSKIKRFVPDFAATIPFGEGIKRTIAWFEADPSRQIIRKETNDWIDGMVERYEKTFRQ